MNHFQKQSVIILIQGIEQQLALLKTLVAMKTGDGMPEEVVRKRPVTDVRYTSAEEDKMLAEMLDLPEDKELSFVQDIFKQASEEKNLNDGVK